MPISNPAHKASCLGSQLTEAHKTALSLLVLETIFVFHHLYGEYFVYRDGLRIISILISLPILAITLAALVVSENRKSRRFMAFSALVVGAWLLFVGLIEGGGFHVLLNILAWLGVPDSTLIKLFTRTTSRDVVNEITGVMELVAAVAVGLHAYRFFKTRETAVEHQR